MANSLRRHSSAKGPDADDGRSRRMDRACAPWQTVGRYATGLRAQRSPQDPQRSRDYPQVDMHAGERASILAELTPPSRLLRPQEQLAPVVFARRIRAASIPRLPGGLPARSAHVAQVRGLLSSMSCSSPWSTLGAPLIAARFPRAYLDVNREPYELDPELFTGRAARLRQHPVGARGGRPRHHRPHRCRQRGDLPRAAAARRRLRAHRAALQPVPCGACRPLGGDARALWHRHSHRLPLDAVGLHGPAGGRPRLRARRSLRRLLRRQAHALHEGRAERAGYEVQINRPYAGGYITEHYGSPARGVHAVQIEINRGLYLDEAAFAKSRISARWRVTIRIWRCRFSQRSPCCSRDGQRPSRVVEPAAELRLMLHRNSLLAGESMHVADSWQSLASRVPGSPTSEARALRK